MGASRVPGVVGLDGRSMQIDEGTMCLVASPLPGRVRIQDTVDGLSKEQKELLLDLTQFGLDIVGVFEPTPFADGTNAVISAGRGDWLGAGISAVSIFPYVGDLSKGAKFPRYVKTIREAIEVARHNKMFAEHLRPLFIRIKGWIDGGAIPTLPQSARSYMQKIRKMIDEFLSSSGSAAKGNASKAMMIGKAVRAPQSFKEAIQLVNAADVMPKGKGIVLWTGYKEGNKAAAENFVRLKKSQGIELTILEDTSAGKMFDKGEIDLSALSDLEVDRVWRRLSERFVEQAKGVVYVFKKGVSDLNGYIAKPIQGIDDYLLEWQGATRRVKAKDGTIFEEARVTTYSTIEQRILQESQREGKVTSIIYDPPVK